MKNIDLKKVIIRNIEEEERGNDPRTLLKVVGMWGVNLEVSDGYHTFDELYDHRITLYIALCRTIKQISDLSLEMGSKPLTIPVWRSKKHSNGEVCFGTGTQFILGIGAGKGDQITYHIPIDRWDETDFAETLDQAPEWDGHTSAEVLERLKNL